MLSEVTAAGPVRLRGGPLALLLKSSMGPCPWTQTRPIPAAELTNTVCAIIRHPPTSYQNKWHGPRLLPNQKGKGKGRGRERRVLVEVVVDGGS